MTIAILSTAMIALAAYVIILHTRLHHAQHDPLTGLCGRALWHQRLTRERHGTRIVAYFDLDDFKSINDTYGHEAGDRVLVETARRLRIALPPTATIARLGGDEFAAMWRCDADSESTHEVVTRLQHTVSGPMDADSTTLPLSVSVGAAVTGPTDDPWDVVAAADQSMYQAKHPNSTWVNSVVRQHQRTHTASTDGACTKPPLSTPSHSIEHTTRPSSIL